MNDVLHKEKIKSQSPHITDLKDLYPINIIKFKCFCVLLTIFQIWNIYFLDKYTFERF